MPTLQAKILFLFFSNSSLKMLYVHFLSRRKAPFLILVLFFLNFFFGSYSEYYADSESITLSVTYSIFKEIQHIKVLTKRFLVKFFGKIRPIYFLFVDLDTSRLRMMEVKIIKFKKFKYNTATWRTIPPRGKYNLMVSGV